MILAGYETTANTLAYSIYLLGKNPKAQQQLLQEIDQSQGRPGYDSLHQFPYAAAVINEALRLYPPATMLSRVATEDVQASKPAPSSGFLAAVLGCWTTCKSVLPDSALCCHLRPVCHGLTAGVTVSSSCNCFL